MPPKTNSKFWRTASADLNPRRDRYSRVGMANEDESRTCVAACALF
jgi:hypothetical protein